MTTKKVIDFVWQVGIVDALMYSSYVLTVTQLIIYADTQG